VQKLALLLRADSPTAGYRSLVSAFQNPGEMLRAGTTEPAGVESTVLGAFPELSPAERMMLADQLSYLPDDLLAKVDRASMSVSLEVRAPLLDHRIVEYAWRLSPDLKMRDGQTKWVLRELLAREVPRELFERPKVGFSVPVRAWLRGPLRPWAEELLAGPSLDEVGVLDANAVRRAWQALLDDRAGTGLGMWAVLQLVAWWHRWRPTAVAGERVA
jgi:asparagine synthase (glutamine-hydrolysing)